MKSSDHNNIFPKQKPIEKIARLASFTEFNPRPVIEIDLEGNIMYENPSSVNIFSDLKKKGAKHKYLSGLPYIVKQLKKGKSSFSREIKFNNRWFRHFFYYMPDFNSIIVYGSDITDRKQAGENLKESEKRDDMLFNSMNYGYALQEILYNKNGKPADYRFLDVNPAFEKLTKLKRKDVVGKTISQIPSTLSHSDSIKNRKNYDNVALTGKPLSFETYHKDLNKYFELYAYKPNENQIALIFSDITHRKKTEEEKNNFISIMSHELRNPLTPILANTQLINSMIAKQDNVDPAIRESVNIIERQSKNMAYLLDDILDVARLSRQKIKLKKKIKNICEIINHATQATMPLINNRRQKLSVVFKSNPMYAYVDPLRFEQIIVNLINNASKYTKTLGHIKVTSAIKQEKIIIKIQDDGVGMDAKKIDKIFELFSGSNKMVMGIGGLGIGLNIVKNLITMHQGSIEAKSEGKNKGSEFIVTIPAITKNYPARTIEPEKTKHTEELTESYSPLKILIVEDNEDIINTLSKILRQDGHDVKTTSNGLTAVTMARTFNPNIALVDIGIPGINGYKVAEAIKHRNIRLIALTGYGQKKDKQLSKKAGFQHHLTKPIDIDYLIKLINEKTPR